MPPLASIVIVAYGQRAVTERCLESLDRSLGEQLGRDIELVLVDNASPDDTLELFGRWSHRARVVALPENRNFSGGCNAGAEAATGEVLVFLNNDTIVGPGVIEELAREARAADVGAVGARLLYPDGTLQHAGVSMIHNPNGLLLPCHLFHGQRGDLPAARCRFDIDLVTAACLATRAEAFAAVGGFDTGYVNGYEDVDLCLRLRVAGLRVVYRGDVSLIHDEGRTRGSVVGDDANLRRFIRTWLRHLEPDTALLADVFDAAPVMVLPGGPPDDPAGASVCVEGIVLGLGPDADEARALLDACAAAGLPAAARDRLPLMVVPRLRSWERHLADRLRPARDGALTLVVGSADRAGAVARLAAPPRGELACERVWAASPYAADALVASGADPRRVEVVPPPVAPVPLGPGGDLLAILPAHDLQEAARALASRPDRVLPSAATPDLLALVAHLAPGAQVLPPCSDESRLAALAADADVVVCADSADEFQRAALVAAAAGAFPVVPRPGAASAVLGDDIVADDVVAGVRAERPDREELAAAVAEACGPAVIAERIGGALAERELASA